jgi:hypothetical protein
MDCYDELLEIDKSEYESIEVQSGEEAADALARFAGDLDRYFTANIRSPRDVKMGDTITDTTDPAPI